MTNPRIYDRSSGELRQAVKIAEDIIDRGHDARERLMAEVKQLREQVATLDAALDRAAREREQLLADVVRLRGEATRYRDALARIEAMSPKGEP